MFFDAISSMESVMATPGYMDNMGDNVITPKHKSSLGAIRFLTSCDKIETTNETSTSAVVIEYLQQDK